jgi:hypothetical protein
MSTTKRFLFDQSACLKNGVLFLSKENDQKETGPGYYSYNTDPMIKPSHNVRAKSPARSVVSISSPRSRPTTPRTQLVSPNSHMSSSDFLQNSFNNSRPRSVSSGRLRNY